MGALGAAGAAVVLRAHTALTDQLKFTSAHSDQRRGRGTAPASLMRRTGASRAHAGRFRAAVAFPTGLMRMLGVVLMLMRLLECGLRDPVVAGGRADGSTLSSLLPIDVLHLQVAGGTRQLGGQAGERTVREGREPH